MDKGKTAASALLDVFPVVAVAIIKEQAAFSFVIYTSSLTLPVGVASCTFLIFQDSNNDDGYSRVRVWQLLLPSVIVTVKNSTEQPVTEE